MYPKIPENQLQKQVQVRRTSGRGSKEKEDMDGKKGSKDNSKDSRKDG